MTGRTLGLLVRVAALAAALLFVGAERAAAQTLDDLLQQRFAEERVFESRVSFDAATAELALPRMRGGASPRERAAAIFAYAASGDPRAAAVVTPLFGQLEGPEQMAALFALSALRPVPRDVLLDTSRLGDPALAPHLGVALVMTRDPAFRTTILQFELPGTPVGDAIRAARAHVEGRPVERPAPALIDYLRLRREAAMRFGRVDGEPWRTRRIRELEADGDWLAEFVLPVGAAVARPWTKDHLLATLVESPRPSVLAAAVEHLGEPLVALVANNLWLPPDTAAWHALLDAIDASPATAGFSAVLGRATLADVDESVQQRAACLLFAAGLAEQSDAIVRAMLESEDADQRLMALRAVSDSAAVDASEYFAAYLEDGDARVRAAAVVAMLVRAPGSASERVRDGLVSEGDLRAPLVAELVRRSDLDSVAVYLALAVNLPGVPREEKSAARAVLLRLGVVEAAALLRNELESGADGPGAARALAALHAARVPGVDLMAVDALLYGRDREYVAAAARLLLVERHPIGLALVRRALWADDFATTQFAAGWIVEHEGLAALEREADAAPTDASEAALRRLGLALGEWGGYGEVQRLVRSRTLRDPLVQGAYLGALAGRTR